MNFSRDIKPVTYLKARASELYRLETISNLGLTRRDSVGGRSF